MKNTTNDGVANDHKPTHVKQTPEKSHTIMSVVKTISSKKEENWERQTSQHRQPYRCPHTPEHLIDLVQKHKCNS